MTKPRQKHLKSYVIVEAVCSNCEDRFDEAILNDRVSRREIADMKKSLLGHLGTWGVDENGNLLCNECINDDAA